MLHTRPSVRQRGLNRCQQYKSFQLNDLTSAGGTSAAGILSSSLFYGPALATTLGIDSVSVPMIAAMTLDLNGNAITLSQTLWREIEDVAPQSVSEPLDASALASVVRSRAAAGRAPLTLASVFPFSSHNYL